MKKQKIPQHMPAWRIPIATIHQTELVIAAIAPRDLRGTHTCKVLMDAKVTSSSIYAYNSGSHSHGFISQTSVGKRSPVLIYVLFPCGCWQDIDECSTRNPCTHKCVNTKGSFQCRCPAGMSGDGLREGSGYNGVGTLVLAIGKCSKQYLNK